MKKTLLTLFTVGLFNFANAQVSAYTFAGSTGSYTAITGGTLLGSTSDDEERFVDPAVPLGGTTTTGLGFPIGFNFTYNGVVFDRLGINTNGWISLGQSSLTPSVNMASGSSYVLVLSQTSTATPTYLRSRIAGLARDLESQAGSSLRIETTGTSPNKVCVIQWTNYAKFNATGDNYNFQIRLNENLNKIEVAYGSFTSSAIIAYAQVGLGGSTNTDFNNRQTTSSWTATTAGTLNTDTCRLSSTVKPVSGQIFTWTPPPVCSGPSTTPTASAPAEVCSGVPFDLVLTGYTPNVSGLTFQWQSSSASGGPFTNLPFGTTTTFDTTQTGTMYYKCLVSCSGGTAVASNIVTVTMSPLVNCNCTSSANFIADEEIFNVTVGTLNNTSSCTTTGGPGSILKRYSNYTTVAAPTLSRTAANAFSVTIGTCGTTAYTSAFKIYIDYNKNGSFAEAGETVYTSDTATALTYTKSGSFTVPTSASSGNTLMRIVNTETDFANTIDSCGTYGYGETEDYFVNIPSLVGIEENEMLNTISVYPNPTTGLFNITTSNANFTQLTISVIDIQGKEVFNTSDKNYSANYNKQINLEGLAKGIYYIRLTTGTGVKTQKLIIQ